MTNESMENFQQGQRGALNKIRWTKISEAEAQMIDPKININNEKKINKRFENQSIYLSRRNLYPPNK